MAKSSQDMGKGKSGDIHQLERIFELMEKHEVAELEWEKKGERLRLKTRYAVAASAENAMSGAMSGAMANAALNALSTRTWNPESAIQSERVSSKAENTAPAKLSPSQKQVVSPFVGTFYRSASPGADPYVKEGQPIKRGDVLCIIEAMKLMNEIEAEFAGKIVSVLVENGQPVEYGEPLFIIEP